MDDFGRPYHRYRRVRRRLPAVDRALLKTPILVVTMAKNYLKQLSSIKIKRFLVMLSCAFVS